MHGVPNLSASDTSASEDIVPWKDDTDPFDLKDNPEVMHLVDKMGVIVRTDFNNDLAWNTFRTSLETSEKEGLAEFKGAIEGVSNVMKDEEDSESGSEEEDEDQKMEDIVEDDSDPPKSSSPASIFHIVEAPPEILQNASNLRILRLLADASIVAAPSRPPPVETQDVYMQVAPKRKEKGAQETSSDDRLVEKAGFKEIYQGGRTFWVYDAQSNVDGSVRLISTGEAGEFGSST